MSRISGDLTQYGRKCREDNQPWCFRKHNIKIHSQQAITSLILGEFNEMFDK